MAIVVLLVYTYLTRIQFGYGLKPLEIGGAGGAIYLYIPGTTPHCLVSTEGNVNFLGT